MRFAGGQIGIIKASNDEIEHKENVLLIAIIIVIAVNLLWLYRSPAVAVVIILVLTTSHFITMSVMTLMDVGMNLNTLPLAALGLGRGVDYSIYMADRIRDEMRHGHEFAKATGRAFNTSGIAVIVTALTMIPVSDQVPSRDGRSVGDHLDVQHGGGAHCCACSNRLAEAAGISV